MLELPSKNISHFDSSIMRWKNKKILLIVRLNHMLCFVKMNFIFNRIHIFTAFYLHAFYLYLKNIKKNLNINICKMFNNYHVYLYAPWLQGPCMTSTIYLYQWVRWFYFRPSNPGKADSACVPSSDVRWLKFLISFITAVRKITRIIYKLPGSVCVVIPSELSIT